MNAFFSSQSGYCPLVWIFHDRKYNSKTNCLYEKMLRIVYKDYKSAFAELLSDNKSSSLRQKCSKATYSNV